MPVYKYYDRDFFKIWSEEMAYVLGFAFADGNIVETKRGTHFFAIYSADKDILIEMKKCFKSDHKISERKSKTGCVYRIQIGSKEWFDDVAKFGLSPNKANRLKLPMIPREYFGDFVRGYFDGDGNVWVGTINKKRATPTKVMQVSFTSASLGYLKELLIALKEVGIKGGSFYTPNSSNYSRLTLSSKDALKLREIMYNGRHKLYLKRKKTVFDSFVKTRA